MNLSVSLLDPVLYDAKRTFYRSPFLFTVSKSSTNLLLLICFLTTE